ncbi:MAG TPA: phytanoyl-CoA dioxygenase family protein [Acidimicrobiales bacterium]|nr:phytanoyl-CoA dioxygenase family protein [Acidimicrobiales bacterium]
MTYPVASDEQIAFFREHGYLVVEDAIPAEDLDELEGHLDTLILQKEKLAFDWAWDASEEKEARSFKIVQSWPELVWPEIVDAPFRTWAAVFGSALLGKEVAFWYNQFLGKPPHNDTPTYWHQDEGYWGRNLTDKGITSWIPLQDVDTTNGCMHFIDGSHKEGVLEHKLVDGVQSDLLHVTPDESRAVACPIKRGDVTFHHSATVHMTTSNDSDHWRKALTQHMQTTDEPGEGDHYPWKIYVNQMTGETVIPDRR